MVRIMLRKSRIRQELGIGQMVGTIIHPNMRSDQRWFLQCLLTVVLKCSRGVRFRTLLELRDRIKKKETGVTLKVLQTPVKRQQFDELKFPGGTQSVLTPYSIHFVHIISSSVLIILSIILEERHTRHLPVMEER